MNWDEPGWYDRGGLVAGLHAMRDAARNASDALEQLRQTTQYIQDHYGASGTGGTSPVPPDDAQPA